MSPNAQIFYMTKLKAGDKRQKGDVYARKAGSYNDGDKTIRQDEQHPVRLIGQVILPVDLIADNFFRPENFLVK